MITVGFDTSNYTTSAAIFDGSTGFNSGRLLEVRPGELGLRQSDALFQHVKRLPDIVEKLLESAAPKDIIAVGASTRPRAVEGSYMPCFLPGESQAKVLAQLLGVPFYAFSHQQGHIAAVLWSSGNLNLLNQQYLAWHLSGGTTELLLVKSGLLAEKIGGTSDISAGQLIDRSGQLLHLDFPAGKALDVLAREGSMKGFPVKVQNMTFSLSGMQNKVQELVLKDTPVSEVARFTLNTCINAIKKATIQARDMYGKNLPVVFTGGVASNRLLRECAGDLNAVFGAPEYSTDNAMGIAVLTYLAENPI